MPPGPLWRRQGSQPGQLHVGQRPYGTVQDPQCFRSSSTHLCLEACSHRSAKCFHSRCSSNCSQSPVPGAWQGTALQERVPHTPTRALHHSVPHPASESPARPPFSCPPQARTCPGQLGPAGLGWPWRPQRSSWAIWTFPEATTICLPSTAAPSFSPVFAASCWQGLPGRVSRRVSLTSSPGTPRHHGDPRWITPKLPSPGLGQNVGALGPAHSMRLPGGNSETWPRLTAQVALLQRAALTYVGELALGAQRHGERRRGRELGSIVRLRQPPGRVGVAPLLGILLRLQLVPAGQ